MHGEHALGVAEHGERLGLGHAVAEVFEVEQGAELGQRHAFHGRGGVGCGAEACRVRGEAEQVDRTAGGGQQVGGDRGEQSAGCGDVAAQGLVRATGHGVDWPAKASAWGSVARRLRKKVVIAFLTCVWLTSSKIRGAGCRGVWWCA